MDRLLVDVSSILRACHHAGTDIEYGYKVEFEGKTHDVNSASHCYYNFLEAWKATLLKTGLKPFQTVAVLDGKNSRSLRQAIFPDYKAHRKPRPPELNKEYNEALEGICDEICNLGGMVVWQDGMECDDVICHLSLNLKGKKTIWCRDKDMLALHRAEDNEGNGVDVLYGQELNPWIDNCCPPEFVLLYKSLVGDPSDGFKGAAGFGPAKFKDLFLRYGKEGMETMLELVEQRRLNELEEDAPDFPPLMKIIQATYSVYVSYACARFYPERINTPANPLQIRMQIGQGTEDIFGEWNQTKRLATPADAAWIIS